MTPRPPSTTSYTVNGCRPTNPRSSLTEEMCPLFKPAKATVCQSNFSILNRTYHMYMCQWHGHWINMIKSYVRILRHQRRNIRGCPPGKSGAPQKKVRERSGAPKNCRFASPLDILYVALLPPMHVLCVEMYMLYTFSFLPLIFKISLRHIELQNMYQRWTSMYPKKDLENDK